MFSTSIKDGSSGTTYLPSIGNTPQKHPFYTEQISGTSFTKKRGENRFSWVYRRLPSVAHLANSKFEVASELSLQKDFEEPLLVDPAPGRWLPLPLLSNSKEKVDFVMGLRLFGGGGVLELNQGLSIYVFQANASMNRKCYCSKDGELLLVLQMGEMEVQTEFGVLKVKKEQIIIIPRGIYFKVSLPASCLEIYGYMVEVYGESGFKLPELGPLGANGLANPMDFLYPEAFCEDGNNDDKGNGYQYFLKFQGKIFKADSTCTPFDIVAWKGNYAPYTYDLNKFCVVNSVSYDHLDPSIFTVLSCPSQTPGVSECDFVIFPPRWVVAENTFRPPYFHRNVMCEFMGLITGVYDGKTAGGFSPGGISLHNRFVPHGPDVVTEKNANAAELHPVKLTDSLAFMFESCYAIKITRHFMQSKVRDDQYALHAWGGFLAKV